MATPFDPTHPDLLTPEQRLDELAALLATAPDASRSCGRTSAKFLHNPSRIDLMFLAHRACMAGVNSPRERRTP